MQQQNLGFNPQTNQQIYMSQHDMRTASPMQQPMSQMYQQSAAHSVNQQPYLLPTQSINSHPLYTQYQHMQSPSPSHQVYSPPYHRGQHQQFAAYQQQYAASPQMWNVNKQFQPNPQLPIIQPTLTEHQSYPPVNPSQMATTSNQYMNSGFYNMQKKSDMLLRSSSPTNEEHGEGYFLPDFITDEIENKTPLAQLQTGKPNSANQSKLGIPLQEDSESQQTADSTGGESIRLQLSNKKVCSICNQETNPYEQLIERMNEQTGLPCFTHIACLSKHSMGHPAELEEPRPNYSQLIRGASLNISPSPRSILQVPLTPDMLVFDFQLLHPMTQTNIFSLSNQSANHVFDQQNSTFLYNKLLCNTTAVPFNMAIVKLRWDFLRDPSQIVDPYSTSNFPTLPQSQHQNMIQGLVNFNDMHSHSDKNITITLKAQPNEQAFMSIQQPSNSTLHLNFNYSNFQDTSYDMQQQQIPQHFLPVTHIIKNLYLSFSLSSKDYEILKENTQRQLQQNPNLVSLLKHQQNPVQSSRFVSTQPGASLHSLFQGAQDSLFSPTLPQQMQQLNINQGRLSPANLSIQQNFNSPMNTQDFQRISPKGSTFSAKVDQHSERKPPGRRMPSENTLMTEEIKANRRERKESADNVESNINESPGDEVGLRRALTCNLNVSTFDGDNQKRILINTDTPLSASGSPKGQTIEPMIKSSPSHLSTGGSARNLFASDKEETGDYLNPMAVRKAGTQKVINSKKDGSRKGSGSSLTSVGKKSKKSTSSVRSNGSSSKSCSSSRLEECDSENAQVISELKGQIVETARQQHGSKYLQKLLARASPDFVGFAIDESIYHLHELMTDQYGNYFCQKLLQSSSSAQRLRILQVLSPNILKISCDRKGTHSMQCLIEMINMVEEEDALRQGIKDHVVDLAFDANGTHVLQKVMLCMKEEHIDFIFNPVFDNLIDLSMDQNGLCVIKKIIAKIQGHDKRMKIGQKLAENVVELVQSPYGNYAVQQALDNWPIQYCEMIFEKLEPHLMQLSVQKFSSNVIEKVLENATYDTVERYLKVLCEHEVMKSLIKNTYGFYVLQKLKEVVKRHGKPQKRIYVAIENTIQYVSDKSLKQKWQQLMTQN